MIISGKYLYLGLTLISLILIYSQDLLQLHHSTNLESNTRGCDSQPTVPLTSSDQTEFNLTTCGLRSFLRGNNQKVVSFTFYDDFVPNLKERKYFLGIRENLRLIKKLYPGFSMRLYYQTSKHQVTEDLCTLARSEPSLDLCSVTTVPLLGNVSHVYPLIWRFLPAIDPQVDVLLS